ncbi:MAG: hypothetical protein K6A72_03840 [Lachnospiraceae bacterium]|nr:hypothetical protein [Lachnospiraceae bacterium]
MNSRDAAVTGRIYRFRTATVHSGKCSSHTAEPHGCFVITRLRVTGDE